MKANELMIGDLVLVDDGQKMNVRKVSSLTRKKIGYHKELNETRMWYAPLISVKPIPLTRDIVEKNGFVDIVKKKTDLTYWDPNLRNIGNILTGRCEVYDFYIEKNCIYNLEYVHKLQHALRLCGKTELADKFKV